MRIFENQWAVILGGSSGLGLATAKKLAKHGMNLCIFHRDRRSDLAKFEEEVSEMKTEKIEIKTFNKNVLNLKEIEDCIHEIPKESVRLLLHSIAKGSLKSMKIKEGNALTLNDLEISIHAMGLNWYEWGRLLIEHNLFMKNARNIAFTSEGNQRVWPSYGAVSAAKAVLEALMRQMAVEWAHLGIRTNCVQAGTTLTASFNIIPQSEIIAQKTLERNPFKRMTIPEDVANAVYLLSREEADWINGTILRADGGESLC